MTGRVAALGMMGRVTDFKTVPYFWSAMFGKTIRYAGNAASVLSRDEYIEMFPNVVHCHLPATQYDEVKALSGPTGV